MLLSRAIRYAVTHSPTKTLSRIGYRANFHIARLLNKKVVNSAYGFRMVANFGDKNFLHYFEAAYGLEYADVVSKIDYPFVYLDIGANQGLYSIVSAKNKNCLAVHAFEPVPATAEIFAQNLSVNGLEAKVKIHCKAISTDNGTAEIRMQDGHSGKSTLVEGLLGKEDDRGLIIETINGASLGDLLAEEPQVDIVIKIDTEGFEPVVFGELRSSGFWPRIREVFFEVNESRFDVDALLAELEKAGLTEVARFGSGVHYDILLHRDIN